MTSLRLRPPAAVRDIAHTLEAAGHEAWCVGGAVRDAFLGIPTLDWDLATSARPEEVQRLFRRTVPVGIRFGTVGVLDRSGVLHEVTTFRHDVETDGRHAMVRFGASLDEDLARRDFTINAIAVHAERLEVRDPFDGRRDLLEGVVRCVGDPDARMEEDRLRALRALRFAGRFGFTIEAGTWAAIRGSAKHLGRLSMERVKQELEKVMEQVAHPSGTLERYRAAGVFAAVIPALAEVTTTRFRTLDYLAMPGLLGRPHRRDLRLAALFVEPGIGPVSRLAAQLKALRYSNIEVALTLDLSRAIGELGALDAWVIDGASDAALRRRVARVGPLFVPLVARVLWAHHRALAGPTGPTPVMCRTARATYRHAMRCAWRDPITLADLAVDGDDLRGAGITAGPQVGRILQQLLDQVLDDPTRNTRDHLLRAAITLHAS